MGLTTNQPDKTAVTSGLDSEMRAGGFAGYSQVRGDKVLGTEAAIFENRKNLNAKRLPKYLAGKSWEKAVGIPPHLPNQAPN